MRLGPVQWSIHKAGAWCRLWRNGPGVIILNRSYEPLFSERNGYRRFWPAWPARWRIRVERHIS
jgi:hypothetical protein